MRAALPLLLILLVCTVGSATALNIAFIVQLCASYYGDQHEFRQRQAPKGSISLRHAKARLNDAENKGLSVPKAFIVESEVSQATRIETRAY